MQTKAPRSRASYDEENTVIVERSVVPVFSGIASERKSAAPMVVVR